MISFVGMPGRSSGKIRGLQVSESLGCGFFDSSRVPVESLEKVVILIRNQAGDFARFLKSREHIVGYDLLDMAVGDLIFRDRDVDLSNYVDPGIDFYIVNNSYQKTELQKHTNSKVFIVPHHTVNYENDRFCRGLEAKKFAYVGLPSQIDRVDEISSFIESLGGIFSIYNPKSREECIECFKNIDVGVVYLDKENKFFKELEKLQLETVIKLNGKVIERTKETINKDLFTGEIEVAIEKFEIVGKTKELPLPVFSDQEYSEEIRLKYRFLDLRRKQIHNNIILRSKVISFIRKEMERMDFLEFQTPILTSSSPEGARDFLVPSRLNPGKFYALPQAPQQFKQLIMISGFDKYFQIAPCFRDEDARADRSPGEFYQLDIEMSFVEQEDVFSVIENLFL